MATAKEPASLGMPWESDYGYSQAVRIGDLIYVSGQFSHDANGNLLSLGDMEDQMRVAYRNVAQVLAAYGSTMDDLVDETLYVTDIEAAIDARAKMREELFGDYPAIASTMVQVDRLAFRQMLVEVRCVARVQLTDRLRIMVT